MNSAHLDRLPCDLDLIEVLSNFDSRRRALQTRRLRKIATKRQLEFGQEDIVSEIHEKPQTNNLFLVLKKWLGIR